METENRKMLRKQRMTDREYRVHVVQSAYKIFGSHCRSNQPDQARSSYFGLVGLGRQGNIGVGLP